MADDLKIKVNGRVWPVTGASDTPLDHDEKARLDELWSRNFDHTNRYEMPLKSSA